MGSQPILAALVNVYTQHAIFDRGRIKYRTLIYQKKDWFQISLNVSQPRGERQPEPLSVRREFYRVSEFLLMTATAATTLTK